MTTQEQPLTNTSFSTEATKSTRFSIAMLGGLAATAIFALLTTLWMPRGPVTAAQLWVVLLGALGVGFVGGVTLRTRWALLLLPLLYMAVVELTRLGAVGPTVDALRLDNPYGILALIVGRGFHGLVAFPPLMLGVGLGLTWLRATETGVSFGRALLHQPLLIVLALGAAGLAVLNALPAHTPPIVDANGQPIPGSIAELTTVRLGGTEQAIMVRGRSAGLPVLLYLSGGPGQSDLAFSRVLFADLTEEFIVVGWDQRGTGKSYAALDPTTDLTLEQAVADTIELTDYLRDRFGEKKIY
ncbi:MAG: alpha/beta fold hydrolase, partial [Caldilinea sp.]